MSICSKKSSKKLGLETVKYGSSASLSKNGRSTGTSVESGVRTIELLLNALRSTSRSVGKAPGESCRLVEDWGFD